MTDSGWWPHNAADLGGYATTVLAIITVFLFVIAFRQFRLLRKQAEDAAKGVAAAEAAAVAAKEATYEAAKSRADASAPRVVVEVGKPLGAYTDINRRAMPYANELRLLDQQSISRSQQIQPGLEFIFDRDRGLFLWFLLRAQGDGQGAGPDCRGTGTQLVVISPLGAWPEHPKHGSGRRGRAHRPRATGCAGDRRGSTPPAPPPSTRRSGPRWQQAS